MGLFTAYTVIVSIEMLRITGLAAIDGGCSGRARFGAVSIGAAGAPNQCFGARDVGAWTAMAVIVASLSIVVATLGVQPAAMRTCWKQGHPDAQRCSNQNGNAR